MSIDACCWPLQRFLLKDKNSQRKAGLQQGNIHIAAGDGTVRGLEQFASPNTPPSTLKQLSPPNGNNDKPSDSIFRASKFSASPPSLSPILHSCPDSDAISNQGRPHKETQERPSNDCQKGSNSGRKKTQTAHYAANVASEKASEKYKRRSWKKIEKRKREKGRGGGREGGRKGAREREREKERERERRGEREREGGSALL